MKAFGSGRSEIPAPDRNMTALWSRKGDRSFRITGQVGADRTDLTDTIMKSRENVDGHER
jgi:hypothetical protein